MRSTLAVFARKNKISLLLIVLLFAGAAVAVLVYLSLERAFYVWDNEFYFRFSTELFQSFNISFSTGFKYLLDSLGNDYNVYYALPIQFFYFIAGPYRPVYEFALVVCYLVPFILVVGLVGRRLLDNKSGRFFWVVIGTVLMLPTVWLPTLRAYPDTAAALATALATLVYLKDPSLKKLGRLLGVGLLVGLAVLLRRHFAYTAISFFGAVGVVTLVRFVGEVRGGETGKAVRRLITRIFQLVLAAVISLATVTLLDPQVVAKTLVVDFNKLYASYIVPSPQVLGWFLDSFGWLPFGLAVVGLVILWRKSDRKEEVLFFGLFGLFELVFWVFYVRQISIQYTLHLSMSILVGLAAFLYYGWQFLKARTATRPVLFRAAAGFGAVLLAANLLAGLVLPGGTVGAQLFSTNWQPLYRNDYQQVIALTNYLDQQTTLDNPIYVVASSYRFNSFTFLDANRIAIGQTTSTLNLLETPDIDSRDYYPLDALLKASIVVVIDPLETHIAPDQQQVVKVVYDMFLQNKALAQDFSVLNPNFPIDTQTRAVVFKRVRSTSTQTALATLQIIQSYVRQRPGIQYGWINLDTLRPVDIGLNDKLGTKFSVDTSKWTSATTAASTTGTITDLGKAELVYAWPTTGQEKFQGKVIFGKDDCGEAAFDFSAAAADQTPTQFAEFKAKPGQGQDFEVDFSKVQTGQFVVLDITPPIQSGCTVTFTLDKVK